MAASRATAGNPSTRGVRRRLGIVVVGDETVASTRCRVLAHLPALSEAGWDATVVTQPSRPRARLLRLPLRALDELRDLRRVRDSDLLLVHRRCYPPWSVPWLGRAGRRMVFDVDDALYLPSPEEPQSPQARRRYRRNFDATATAADLVLCGNSTIAAEVGHGRTTIVPTAVDCDRFRPEVVGRPEPTTAVWVGHSSNLGYLEAIAGPLREVASRHPGFRLVVIADRKPRLEGVPVEFRAWSLKRELDDLRGVGIGLMPLDDTPWTRAKCAFKLLQYMALGLPAVVSPVGMNRDLVQHGKNAFLAATGTDWVDRLEAVIGNPELAAGIGHAARATAIRGYALDVVSRMLVAELDGVASSSPRAVGLS